MAAANSNPASPGSPELHAPPRFAQRIDLTFSHVHFNHPAGDQRKQFTAGFLQFFPVGDIALQRWASDVQGAFLIQDPRLTPVTGPEKLPKLTIRPRRCRQSREASRYLSPPSRRRRPLLTVGERLEPLHDRLLAIVNRLPGARLFGALRFLRAADGTDKFRPSAFAH